MTPQVEQFFAYARERYRVLLNRRAGKPWPWTPDPILQKYRFCNVFREDDVVTQWVEANLRKPLRDGQHTLPRVLTVLTVARFINRVSTLEHLAPTLLNNGWGHWCLAILRGLPAPIITGAYMIRTPHGVDKITGLDAIFSNVQTRLGMDEYDLNRYTTLAQFHDRLIHYPYVGSFMAYEVVTDFRWVRPDLAPDRMNWAVAGPGAARGLSRVFRGELGHYRNTPSQQPEMLERMWELLEFSRKSEYWPADWPSWEMRDCEHLACEWDKYERARLGQGEPKQLYHHHDQPGIQTAREAVRPSQRMHR